MTTQPLDDAPPVHVLRHGYALCGQEGLPCDWPPGHRWVSVLEAEALATCETCKAESLRITPR